MSASASAVFSPSATQLLLMQLEVALARVQADRGTVPRAAADEIERTATLTHVPLEAVEAERRRVGHPMAALLNVWMRSAQDGAGQWLHYGATTQDIFDTVQLQQLRRASTCLIAQMRRAEAALLVHARTHRATPMIGRTVGRHALPMTFGLKAAGWMAENRRAIDRLAAWSARCDTGLLSGAVGSYAALGPDAFALEADVLRAFGAGAPLAADWKGSRDMHAEFGALAAIAAQTWRKIAQEVFLLQGDDIRELEDPSVSTVGSSTMPHKVNPGQSRAVIAFARLIPGHAAVLADWMVCIHERDQISSAATLAALVGDCERMFNAAVAMVENLVVRPAAMHHNLGRTRGLIMAEHAMFVLAPHIGKQSAHAVVSRAAHHARQGGATLAEALRAQPEIEALEDRIDLDALLAPEAYIGLAPEVADRTVHAIEALRAAESIDP